MEYRITKGIEDEIIIHFPDDTHIAFQKHFFEAVITHDENAEQTINRIVACRWADLQREEFEKRNHVDIADITKAMEDKNA